MGSESHGHGEDTHSVSVFFYAKKTMKNRTGEILLLLIKILLLLKRYAIIIYKVK